MKVNKSAFNRLTWRGCKLILMFQQYDFSSVIYIGECDRLHRQELFQWRFSWGMTQLVYWRYLCIIATVALLHPVRYGYGKKYSIASSRGVFAGLVYIINDSKQKQGGFHWCHALILLEIYLVEIFIIDTALTIYTCSFHDTNHRL